jgi:hypothetical protein
MGFRFDRILSGFDGPFEAVGWGVLQRPQTTFSPSSAGYILDARTNNSFVAVNDLLQAGAEVYRIGKGSSNTLSVAPGSFFIPAGGKATSVLEKAAGELGVNALPSSKRPSEMTPVSKLRIALWDTAGGSMTSGWVRWILEQHHYPFKTIYAGEINRGNLRDKYDVIVFPGGGISAVTGPSRPSRDTSFRIEDVPAEYRETIGRITADTSVPQLRRFLEEGGSIVTIGSSTNLAYQLRLPVRNALVEMQDGKEMGLPREKFYIPGSILRAAIDSTQKAAWGMNASADVYFNNSPVFTVAPDAIASGKIKPLIWFVSDKSLRSGWAWGQEYLRGGVTAFSSAVGKGSFYAFGPEITFRSQTHGTFKLLFNQLYGEK